MATLIEIVTSQVPQRIIGQELVLESLQLRKIRSLQVEQALASVSDLRNFNGPLQLIIKIVALYYSVIVVSLEVVGAL